jgi:UDP-glucose-4-epimerase GalE
LAAPDRRVVLVTGGAGYVGSHCAKALRRAGYQVVIFDNLSAGHREAALGAPFIEGDVRDTTAVRRALRESGASAVLHFAARLNVAESMGDAAGYYDTNLRGSLATLEAMAAHACSLFVFSSTCAVYGEPVQVPIDEAHRTIPINPYGETKLAVEQALPRFEKEHGIRSIRLRYFNAAGADPDGELGEDHNPEIHAVPRALAAVTGGPAFEVYGDDYGTPDGTCLRDYVHVTDLAEAHVLALRHLEQGGASATYNLGTERPTSVLELLASVERVTGRPVPRRMAARRPGDPAVLYASAARIRADWGWVPQRPTLDTIVGDAWRWHSKYPGGFEPQAR